MILLYISIVLLGICVVIGTMYGIKKIGFTTIAKEAALSFLGTFLIVILLSLIKDKTFLNPDKLYLPFASLCAPSLVRFFSIKK
ncbi:hypothetical protein Ana3638_19905 [Anaerocolumna sedimenticola]|uniref:Uncharacterized protein n=1 Tax=Anaerocolumna sedimenticola TaxID=2696063 RepID=A0A6P1TQK6_9FIRM|nr:hypothetical protein [Anaerocolumna sedimenticola]QHQ62763.1 hypothetical protein Ana3638_19905 [Anaerocolumna sedimenticola]